jgi:hypothetical protein
MYGGLLFSYCIDIDIAIAIAIVSTVCLLLFCEYCTLDDYLNFNFNVVVSTVFIFTLDGWMDGWMDGCGWMWMDVDGCGWMWMDVDGCGWMKKVKYKSSFFCLVLFLLSIRFLREVFDRGLLCLKQLSHVWKFEIS